ncbi:MAG TPA: NAD(P)/FAD-dependent oxidoreductase [Chitinophagales bacterium]|nr:NAD(P)/FAD-dependent oxidoreductase [Chitinophagales bacterium]MBP6154594.1 NAD(P)/FAD-dependent oxidoreductase [Chitinophagales bacterium]HQV77264.1 NAD(P)/FAD-dependent oxidoreductase [Chitinophagales bacterium]HQW78325.1 NAD(P)/FAD-dependent oxidoreductase [Chitinophagales bacterium]HRB67765.1 NAD(P)/FAD-dependent oxidoreductase [Chitinophagales bacterium]
MDLKIPSTGQKRVVIIGGGFGGIEVAKHLSEKDVQIVLLDKHNYHCFQPLLYQVATGGLEPGSIAYPLRKFMQEIPNGIFRMAEVRNINIEQQKVHTDIGDLKYDYLIIATGSMTNFFKFPKEVSSKMMQMKDIPQALNLRSFILENFEEALLTYDESKKEKLINITIVGGGPTGVELAGALGEMRKNILPKDYPEIDFRKMQIHLFESADRLLSAMSPENSEKALKYVKDFGVSIWLNTMVTDFDGEVISTADGKVIKSETVIWTAGVKGNPIEGFSPNTMVGGSRILVDEFCKVINHTNIFAIGDVAAMVSDEFPKGHPMVAPVALQQGELVAKNILAEMKNKTVKSFKYHDKGSMATVGRNKAVMESKGIKMGGFVAWLAWLFVHVTSLIGFRNKITVTLGWLYNYITYDRTLRLIIRPFKNKEE